MPIYSVGDNGNKEIYFGDIKHIPFEEIDEGEAPVLKSRVLMC